MKSLLWTIGLLAFAHAGGHAAPAPTVAGKKIVKIYGLDKPDPQYLRAHVAEIEQLALDGICIVVPTDEPKEGDNSRAHGNYLWFGATPLSRQDFAANVEHLKQTKFTRLRYNFMHYAARGPGPFDWFDDAVWDQIVENARVAAWVVRESGMVGITFDSEIAFGGFWKYDREKDGRTFDACRRVVRRRGRAWARALSQEHPRIIICLSHGHHVAAPYARAADPAETYSDPMLAEQDYALYPAYLDGVLEGLGPRATIVNGCEETYNRMVYRAFANFRRWAHAEGLKLTTVPDLYRKKMKYAMALWPGFRSDRGGMWDPKKPDSNFFTPDNLAHAIHNAMAASDDFAWMWSGVDI